MCTYSAQSVKRSNIAFSRALKASCISCDGSAVDMVMSIPVNVNRMSFVEKNRDELPREATDLLFGSTKENTRPKPTREVVRSSADIDQFNQKCKN